MQILTPQMRRIQVSGLTAKKRNGFLGPRPLAWAVLVRPFRAHFGISSARTPGVQREMWDTLSPKGEGC